MKWSHHIPDRRLGLAVACALALVLAAGCGSDSSSGSSDGDQTDSSSDTPVSITYVAPAIGNPFYAPVQAGAEAAAGELDLDVEYVGPANGDPQQQVAMINAAAQKQVDAIVVLSGTPDAAKGAIDRAVDAGIVVATTNADTPGSKRTFFVGSDFEMEGQVQAKALAATLKAEQRTEDVKIAITECIPGNEALKTRVEAFKSTLSDDPDITFEVVGQFASSLDTVKNKQVYDNIISANPDVDVLYGTCAVDTRNAGTVAKEAGNRDIIAFGFDLLPDTLRLIDEGWVRWSLGQNPYEQGFLPAQLLADHVRDDKPLPDGFVQVETELVTPDEELEPVTAEFPDVMLVTDIMGTLERESVYYEE